VATRAHELRTAARTALQRLRGWLARYPLCCNLCGCRVPAFLPLPADLLRELDRAGFPRNLLLGSETLSVAHYLCPVCRATDRDRLIGLFLSRVPDGSASLPWPKMLDVAPSMPLRAYILRSRRFAYRSVDLTDLRADDRADVQDLRLYDDATFDCVLCSHVLEHVPDDHRALRELRRVLRPGGWAVILAPVALPLEGTREDPTLLDPLERTRRFGQADHLRLYAKADLIARIESAGFSEVKQLDATFFGLKTFARHGIAAPSVLYVAGGPQAKPAR